MNSFKIFIFVSLLIAPLASKSLASGVITISGKLTSITQTQYLVETRKSTYYIRRDSLSPKVVETLNKTDIPVTLTIPLDSITLVRSKKSTSG